MEDQYNESTEESTPIQNAPAKKEIFSPETLVQFLGAAKWAKVISVIYLVLIGLVILAILLSASTFLLMLGNAAEGIILLIGIIFYAALLVLVFFVLYKLYNFSKYAQRFSLSGSDDDLKQSFASLRQFFLYIVISMIATFLLYIVMAIGMFLFASNISDF